MDSALRFNTIVVAGHEFIRMDHASSTVHMLTGLHVYDYHFELLDHYGLIDLRVMKDATYVSVDKLYDTLTNHLHRIVQLDGCEPE